MKKIDITNNKSPNFIGAYNIENDSLCEKIVSFFEENKDLQSQGAVGDGVDEKIKKSTDITIYPNNLKEEKFFLFKDYLNSLNKCYQDYRETYPFLKKFITKVDLGYFNIQKYYIGKEPLLSYTGESPISGSINFDEKSFGFESGYLTEYSVSAGIGRIPESSASIVVYGDIGSGISASGSESHPAIEIPNQGSISLNATGYQSNRITDFSYSMRINARLL